MNVYVPSYIVVHLIVTWIMEPNKQTEMSYIQPAFIQNVCARASSETDRGMHKIQHNWKKPFLPAQAYAIKLVKDQTTNVFTTV